MKVSAQIQKTLAAQPVQLAIAVVLVAGAGYWLLRRAAKDSTDAASAGVDAIGGIFSGNNRLTEGTPYEDAGILGTIGSGVNELLGGAPEKLGSKLGGWLADLFVDKSKVEGRFSQEEAWLHADMNEGIQ